MSVLWGFYQDSMMSYEGAHEGSKECKMALHDAVRSSSSTLGLNVCGRYTKAPSNELTQSVSERV